MSDRWWTRYVSPRERENLNKPKKGPFLVRQILSFSGLTVIAVKTLAEECVQSLQGIRNPFFQPKKRYNQSQSESLTQMRSLVTLALKTATSLGTCPRIRCIQSWRVGDSALQEMRQRKLEMGFQMRWECSVERTLSMRFKEPSMPR